MAANTPSLAGMLNKETRQKSGLVCCLPLLLQRPAVVNTEIQEGTDN
jgi:hypothetical protein